MSERKTRDCVGECPHCGSHMVEYNETPQSHDTRIEFSAVCGDCKGVFSESYSTSYVETVYEDKGENNGNQNNNQL